MATRATIKVEGFKLAKLYKHFDGYPSATLQWLQDFNKRFLDGRGYDPCYQLAQLIRSSSKDAEKYNLDPSDTTGWAVFGYDDECGAEYEYELKKDGSVKVIEIPYEYEVKQNEYRT